MSAAAKWRESASLILISKQQSFSSQHNHQIINNNNNNNFPKSNYKLLVLERSGTSSFMPGSYVFPGGAIDQCDSNLDWYKLFQHFGIHDEHFNIFKNVLNKPPIYQNSTPSTIPKYVSLRISAIRETFEECGILLCKSQFDQTTTKSKWVSWLGGSEIVKWQKIIHDDPSEFFHFCVKFEMYPDLWALHDWSNWLTPCLMDKRFDSIFYMAACETNPPIFAEKTEAKSAKWARPDELLEENFAGKIKLPPPQFYELSRLKQMNDFDELAKYSDRRSVNGCERFLPFKVNAPNAFVTVLPGDDLYPDGDQAQDPELVIDVSETKVMHRIYLTKKHTKIVLNNFLPKVPHLVPVTDDIPKSSL